MRMGWQVPGGPAVGPAQAARVPFGHPRDGAARSAPLPVTRTTPLGRLEEAAIGFPPTYKFDK